jgi:hypothetical protein
MRAIRRGARRRRRIEEDDRERTQCLGNKRSSMDVESAEESGACTVNRWCEIHM